MLSWIFAPAARPRCSPRCCPRSLRRHGRSRRRRDRERVYLALGGRAKDAFHDLVIEASSDGTTWDVVKRARDGTSPSRSETTPGSSSWRTFDGTLELIGYDRRELGGRELEL